MAQKNWRNTSNLTLRVEFGILAQYLKLVAGPRSSKCPPLCGWLIRHLPGSLPLIGPGGPRAADCLCAVAALTPTGECVIYRIQRHRRRRLRGRAAFRRDESEVVLMN